MVADSVVIIFKSQNGYFSSFTTLESMKLTILNAQISSSFENTLSDKISLGTTRHQDNTVIIFFRTFIAILFIHQDLCFGYGMLNPIR